MCIVATYNSSINTETTSQPINKMLLSANLAANQSYSCSEKIRFEEQLCQVRVDLRSYVAWKSNYPINQCKKSFHKVKGNIYTIIMSIKLNIQSINIQFAQLRASHSGHLTSKIRVINSKYHYIVQKNVSNLLIVQLWGLECTYLL